MDGVVIAASSLGVRHREWLAEPRIPSWCSDNAVDDVGLPTIASDSRGGARMAIDHLVALGHRRFANISRHRRGTSMDRPSGGRPGWGAAAAGSTPGALMVAADEAGVAGGERAMREVFPPGPTCRPCSPTTT